MSLVIVRFLRSSAPQGVPAAPGVIGAIAGIGTKVTGALANRPARIGGAAIDDRLLRDMGLSRTGLAFDIREPWRN
jgi:hypothetical protein